MSGKYNGMQVVIRQKCPLAELQSADQEINAAAAIYESLEEYVKDKRPKFEQFEAEGKLLSGCERYEDEMKRHRQWNRLYDEPGSTPYVELTPTKNFRTATFLVINNCLVAKLKKRREAYYATVASRFGFLRNIKESLHLKWRRNAKHLLSQKMS